MCAVVSHAYHNVNFVAQSAVLFAFDAEQHAIEQENVTGSFGTVHAERALGHQFAVGGQIFTGPSVQKALHLLDPYGVFVFPLHVVDVMSDARHGRQSDDDVRIAGRLRSVAMFDDVLQQQVVLEDTLDRFQQVGTERQRVLQLRLSLTTRPTGSLVPHQICQHRHFPNLNPK